MKRHLQRILICFFITLVLCAGFPQGSFAEEKGDITGWEFGSPYNRLYDPSEWDKLKGEALRFKDVTPMPGMSPGIALIMRDREEEIVTCHLGPKAYIDSLNIGVRKGEKVTVKGVWVEINGEDIFIASKVKKGEYYEFKVRRTQDGKPYWAMTPEELEAQKADK
jgi:hypothetical protein